MIGAAEFVTSRMLLRALRVARLATIVLAIASLAVALSIYAIARETERARSSAAELRTWRSELRVLAGFDRDGKASKLARTLYDTRVAAQAEAVDTTVQSAFADVIAIPKDALWSLDVHDDETVDDGTWNGTLRFVHWPSMKKIATALRAALAEPLPIDLDRCEINEDGSSFDFGIAPLSDELRNKLESCRDALTAPHAVLDEELRKLCIPRVVQYIDCDISPEVETAAGLAADRLALDQRRALHASTWIGSAGASADAMLIPVGDTPPSILWLSWILVSLGFALIVTMVVAARRAAGFFDRLPPGVEESRWRRFPVLVMTLALGAGAFLPLAMPSLRDVSIDTWRTVGGILLLFTILVGYVQHRLNQTIEELV